MHNPIRYEVAVHFKEAGLLSAIGAALTLGNSAADSCKMFISENGIAISEYRFNAGRLEAEKYARKLEDELNEHGLTATVEKWNLPLIR